MTTTALRADDRPIVDARQIGISVIIPTCDRPHFLREAVKSALAQTLRPMEILVIDNGLKPLSLSGFPAHVRTSRLAAMIGPSRARNFGAAIATGTHLAFLDDDDFWDENFLAAAATAMTREGCECAYGRTRLVTDGGVTDYKLPTREALNLPTLLERNPGTGGTNLLIDRRLFLEVGGFDQALRLSEDRALAIELVLAGKAIAIAPDAIAFVRYHDGPRLTRHHLRKLSFIWKYRRCRSKLKLTGAAARVLIVFVLETTFGGLPARAVRRFALRFSRPVRAENCRIDDRRVVATAPGIAVQDQSTDSAVLALDAPLGQMAELNERLSPSVSREKRDRSILARSC